jgi:hypothetical protein
LNSRAGWCVPGPFIRAAGVNRRGALSDLRGVAPALAGGRSCGLMADQDKPKPKPKRSGRTTALAGLLAVVAVIAAWLSNCIPGFGIGSESGDGEAEQAQESEPARPAEPEPEPEPEPAEPSETEPEVRKPMPIKLTIDARGCSIDGGESIDCKALCDDPKRFEGRDAVIIDAKDGPHAAVVDALDCLKTHDLSVSINRE